MRFYLIALIVVVVMFAQGLSAAPIHDAVAAGDMLRVKQILSQDPKQIQSKDYATGCIVEGLTPLHAAARMDMVGMAKYLLSQGAKVNAKDNFRRIALHDAKSRDMAALFVSSGANFNAKDRNGHTPLHYAGLGRRKDVVKLLLECRARVETIVDAVLVDDRAKVEAMLDADPALLSKNEWNGPTLLGYAAGAGNHEMMQLLISKGADINAKSEYDDVTPLHDAVEWDDVDAVKNLLANGADIHAGNTYEQTPLHLAAWYDSRKAAALLIASGADPNARDYHQATPLHEAVCYGYSEFARMLLVAGADVDARTEDGATPLHYAANENLDVVKLVVEQGADVNAVTEYGLSPLTYAEFKHTADYLVSKGAKPQNFFDYALLGDITEMERMIEKYPEIMDESPMWTERTPIYHAVIGDSLPAVEFLISKGADVNVCDVNGVTPLGLAKRLGRVEIAKVLRGHGAR